MFLRYVLYSFVIVLILESLNFSVYTLLFSTTTSVVLLCNCTCGVRCKGQSTLRLTNGWPGTCWQDELERSWVDTLILFLPFPWSLPWAWPAYSSAPGWIFPSCIISLLHYLCNICAVTVPPAPPPPYRPSVDPPAPNTAANCPEYFFLVIYDSLYRRFPIYTAVFPPVPRAAVWGGGGVDRTNKLKVVPD